MDSSLCNLYRYVAWDELISPHELLERIGQHSGLTSDQWGEIGDLIALQFRPDARPDARPDTCPDARPDTRFVSKEELFNFAHTRYAVIDFETSGGPMSENRIMEIGCVIAEGNIIVERYSRLINPHGPVHPYVWELTGISRREVAAAPPLDEYLDEFLEKIQDIPLFAHNSSFDQQVLNQELARRNRPPLDYWFCTVTWARRLLPGLGKYKLAVLAKTLGLHLTNAHRGLADAEATWELIGHLARSSASRNWDLMHLLHAARAGRIKPQEINEIWGDESVCSDSSG